MPLHKPVTQTAEQLKQVANDIQRQAQELHAFATGMELIGFASLDITNYDQLRRAQEYLDNYVHAAKTALRKARNQRGDFATVPPPKPAKKAAK